jgi:regulatory protein
MKFKPVTKIYTVQKAFEKMSAYCVREERCHQDIFQKLWAYGMNTEEADEVIAMLITEGFLNESRYSKAYARGKFRIYKWGKKKIKAGLMQKGISSACIIDGLSAIEEDEYMIQLEKIILSKLEQDKAIDFRQKQTAITYALSKGYEMDLIDRILGKMNS